MSTDRLWRWALRVSAALTIVPLYCARHLPFCDLPEHLAAIATLRHWWDPAWRSQEYFTLAIAKTQYLLYYVVAALLSVPFGSAERANLFLLTLVGLGFPYALRELLRALERDERLAIIGCPLFWNRALAEGLVNYVASIPLVVWGLALAVRQARAPTRRRGIGLAVLSVAVFYLHLSSFLLLMVGAAAITWLLPAPAPEERTARALLARVPRVPLRMPWVAPVAVLSVAFLLTSTVTHPDKSQGSHAGLVKFAPKRVLVEELFGWMHDIWFSLGDDAAAVALWIAFAVLVVRRPSKTATQAERWMHVTGAVLFAVACAFYFFMPSQVGFAFLLDVRLAPFVGLLAPLWLPRRRDARTNVALAAMTAASLFLSIHCAWQMRGFEREEASHFDDVIRNLPRGKKLLMLVFSRQSERAIITPFVHFGAYYRARYGGIASFSFTELPHWPIHYRPEVAPPKKRIVFWDWNPCLFRNSHDGPYYDFVLTRGEVDPFAGSPPGPQWRAIGGSRDWKLWARTDGWTAGDPASDTGPCKNEPPPADGPYADDPLEAPAGELR
jgi:hypothetical protein